MDLITFQNSQPNREETDNRQGSLNRQKSGSNNLRSTGIIHDLANFCYIILGNTELLMMDRALREKHNRLLSIINATASKTVELCQEFMAESIEDISGSSLFSLNNLIEEISALKMENSAQIIYRSDLGLWNIRAHSKEIKILLQNILYNADQSMPGGGDIVISAENIHDSNSLDPDRECQVKISIKDNGCGIPENLMDKIFLPKFTTKKNGNGIGLALCKQITDKYKGSIQVDSIPEKGTVVSVFLPAVYSQAC